MKIFVIGGLAKSGKNTLGEFLREKFKDYGYKPCVMHITEPLYSYARNYFEWDGNVQDKPREFLQKMGIEIIREKLGKKDFLLNRLYEDIDILKNFFDVFIITDARFINEFKNIKAKYDNVISIKIERNNYDNQLSEEEAKHITENEIKNYKDFDYIVENKSISSLEIAASEIVRNEEKEGNELI